MDHRTGEGVGIHASISATRFETLDPIRQDNSEPIPMYYHCYELSITAGTTPPFLIGRATGGHVEGSGGYEVRAPVAILAFNRPDVARRFSEHVVSYGPRRPRVHWTLVFDRTTGPKATAWKANGPRVVPRRGHVSNIGHEEGSTHRRSNPWYAHLPLEQLVFLLRHSTDVQRLAEYDAVVQRRRHRRSVLSEISSVAKQGSK